MREQTTSFGGTATSLARNPLGIIALFIVLVYGFAAFVTAFSSSFSAGERVLLIYFLVGFPVLVLAVFSWLVSNHSGKLFAPADFKNEENYVKMQLTAVASLTAASSKDPSSTAPPDLQRIVTAVQGTRRSDNSDDWRNHILWVDDRPQNNTYERQAFEAIGLQFTLALSTVEAFEHLKNQNYAAIISDMGRREGSREGYVLLDRLRASGDRTPLFFYASSNAPDHQKQTMEHGGQGCTNNAQELFEMVTRAVVGSVGSHGR